jgi:hypothetical protein
VAQNTVTAHNKGRTPLGGLCARDGPPGVKTIWKGLQKLYTLLDYRELFDFVGQV